MAFGNLVAYLAIKIRIKFKLKKNSPTTKNGVSENRKPKRPNCHQNEPKRRSPKNQKELDS